MANWAVYNGPGGLPQAQPLGDQARAAGELAGGGGGHGVPGGGHLAAVGGAPQGGGGGGRRRRLRVRGWMRPGRLLRGADGNWSNNRTERLIRR